MIKQYLIFATTGEILRSISCPEEMLNIQIQANETAMEGIANDSLQYIPDVNDPIVTDKLANPTAIDKISVLADGIDQVALSDIPVNAEIAILGLEAGVHILEAIGVSDTITFDTVGKYKLTITAFPYLNYEVEVDAI